MSALAALFAAGVAASAGAQEAAPPSWWGGEDDGLTMGPWMMNPHGMMSYGNMAQGMMASGRGPICAWMGSHIEGRLAYVKTEVGITHAQESLWQAYADAVRNSTLSMVAHCTAMMEQPRSSALTLPERLDQHEELMGAQLDALRAMDAALEPLYGAFNETQKAAADQLFRGPMGMIAW